jgi:hypothetical protein
MSTCQLLSDRSKAAQTTSAGSRLSARKLAIRRAGASSAVRRAIKLAAGGGFVSVGHSGLCTRRQATSTGIINRI